MLDDPMFTAGRRSGFRQFLFYWFPVLAYIAAIFYVSSLSHPPTPLTFPNADKLEHLCEYGLLGLLLGRAVRFSLAPYSVLASVVMTVSFVMLVGAADEYFQSFVPGRESDPMDWLTDSTAGVLSQVVLARVWGWQKARARAREAGRSA